MIAALLPPHTHTEKHRALPDQWASIAAMAWKPCRAIAHPPTHPPPANRGRFSLAQVNSVMLYISPPKKNPDKSSPDHWVFMIAEAKKTLEAIDLPPTRHTH